MEKALLESSSAPAEGKAALDTTGLLGTTDLGIDKYFLSSTLRTPSPFRDNQ